MIVKGTMSTIAETMTVAVEVEVVVMDVTRTVAVEVEEDATEVEEDEMAADACQVIAVVVRRMTIGWIKETTATIQLYAAADEVVVVVFTMTNVVDEVVVVSNAEVDEEEDVMVVEGTVEEVEDVMHQTSVSALTMTLREAKVEKSITRNPTMREADTKEGTMKATTTMDAMIKATTIKAMVATEDSEEATVVVGVEDTVEDVAEEEGVPIRGAAEEEEAVSMVTENSKEMK
mmetsp:Transcript_10222/g.16972  ORF Transcript_10222/g.16972 Transcript_10222/m.16972 type:complete len:232 (+) Transcript_10222:312-1007(+)